MDYVELSAAQRLHYVNTRQLFEVLSVVGDPARIRHRLAEQAATNISVGIARVPLAVAEHGVLSGPAAIYAYEAAAGVHVSADLIGGRSCYAAEPAFQAVAIAEDGWPMLLRAIDPRDFVVTDDRLSAVVRELIVHHLAGMLAASKQKSPVPFRNCRAIGWRLPDYAKQSSSMRNVSSVCGNAATGRPVCPSPANAAPGLDRPEPFGCDTMGHGGHIIPEPVMGI